MNPSNIIPGSIESGYGEFYVFNTTGVKVPKDKYDAAFQIIAESSLIAIARSDKANKSELAQHRVTIMREKIKQLDPALEIGFIPRVLYELLFIRKCMKEEIRDQEFCDYCYKGAAREIEKHPENEETIKQDIIKRKCWHAKSFGPENSSQDPILRNYAFRINKYIVKALKPTTSGFTYQQFKKFAEIEIQQLQKFYSEFKPFEERKGESLTLNMSKEGAFGIANEKQSQLILKVLELECSKISQNAFLLYRGSGANGSDSIFCKFSDQSDYHRLSYGTGLFAGCVFDSTATAFYFMRQEVLDGFALVVPIEKLSRSIFDYPEGNGLSQLLGRGEYFHVSTKRWKGLWADVQSPDRYINWDSDIEKSDYIAQFQDYSSRTIFLSQHVRDIHLHPN